MANKEQVLYHLRNFKNDIIKILNSKDNLHCTLTQYSFDDTPALISQIDPNLALDRLQFDIKNIDQEYINRMNKWRNDSHLNNCVEKQTVRT